MKLFNFKNTNYYLSENFKKIESLGLRNGQVLKYNLGQKVLMKPTDLI
jgi:hypothetical protein